MKTRAIVTTNGAGGTNLLNRPFATTPGVMGKIIEGLDIMTDLNSRDTLKVMDNLWHLTLTPHFDLPREVSRSTFSHSPSNE